jgi:trehalose-phosphatase
LVFLKQDISYQQYLALLTVADTLMITSLREGMNLTSHEYIFCQDGKFSKKKYGPLILSEFTGSAAVFNGADLSVNPWDYQKCADAILYALEMKEDDRKKRWEKLYAAVTHHTAAYWFTTFLAELSRVWKDEQARDTMSIPRLSVNSLCKDYQDSSRRLFILDYEGTLAPKSSSVNTLLTSPQRTLDALNELLLDSKNVVYVMSGNSTADLESLFRRVPTIGLIAENGYYVRDFGADEWQVMGDEQEMHSWQKAVMDILEYYQERVPGSVVERRPCSLIFHFANAEDPQSAARQAGECANHINDSGENQRVHALTIEGALLVESKECDKATAALHMFDAMAKTEKPDFLMVAGDAREDEPVFRWANLLGKKKEVSRVATVAVGPRSTEAAATLAQGVTGKF